MEKFAKGYLEIAQNVTGTHVIFNDYSGIGPASEVLIPKEDISEVIEYLKKIQENDFQWLEFEATENSVSPVDSRLVLKVMLENGTISTGTSSCYVWNKCSEGTSIVKYGELNETMGN